MIAIGRQDQYSIVHGGFNCWEFGQDYARRTQVDIPRETLEEFKKGLLLLHTGASRNAQSAVEEVYMNHKTKAGQDALDKLAAYALEFAVALKNKEFILCAEIMEKNLIMGALTRGRYLKRDLKWCQQSKIAADSSNFDKAHAFIDTQTVYMWPVLYKKLVPFLTEEMKEYWKGRFKA